VEPDLMSRAAPRRAVQNGAELQPGPPVGTSQLAVTPEAERISGVALQVAASFLYEDATNPRTEFVDTELDELAEDIRVRGILQPIIVHPADRAGRYRVHFGTMRLRAALRVGLELVPIVVRDAAADPYAAVAENQKRHGLTPLDLARFIRCRLDAGESNVAVSKGLGLDPTSVAHYLALLTPPPVLDAALKTGRCLQSSRRAWPSWWPETRPSRVSPRPWFGTLYAPLPKPSSH
jgi:ParB family chromosome partitioning protein